ncbi:uncharacterized protein F58A4.6 [Leptinotarsa decemlineata]|uniref:uncharacterized protein F58A4.6 n=1 Tax=Leptinotarsa decemlineata TaxID=7539 RepID=UPI000C2539DF|nr:uncharacterized protein F58A4.6 [Leptinotarsa decemlineata]
MKMLLLNILEDTNFYYFGQYSVRKKGTEKKELKTNIKNGRFVYIDCAFFHYLLKELLISKFYRLNFLYFWNVESNGSLEIVLQPTKYDLIDYNWNERIYQMVREKCELDNALSWLSTLGGAFSALGDYFPNCAHTAGKISFHQLYLALRLGDPNIVSRCQLYFSLSLIQQKRYKTARRIISKEYQNAKNATIVDNRLLNMCKGIWSKMQYEYNLYKRSRTK